MPDSAEVLDLERHARRRDLERSLYPTTVPPIEVLIGEKRVFLQYSIEAVQRLKLRLGKSMFGLQGGILNVDEDMLPVLLEEGLCNEDGSRLGHYENVEGGARRFVPDITAGEIAKLPAAMYRYLLDDFSHAWNGAMPENKKKRMESIDRLLASETTSPTS